jgi:hypothetical protein
MLRIIRRAGLTPWERAFHNLRASRQNELSATFPIHFVCRWIGNSALIANKHYLSETDDCFEAAVKSDAHQSGQDGSESAGVDTASESLALPLKNRQKVYPGQESNL